MYTNNIEGWMTQEELSWLYSTARIMGSIAEIGCWHGRSTHALASGCSGTVYAIDHWLGSPGERTTYHSGAVRSREAFLNNMSAKKNIVVMEMDSMDALAHVPKVEMVFIDASHEYEDVLRDIVEWDKKATRLLCGHDYTDWPGVRRAVDEYARNRPVFLTGSIWQLWKR